MVYSFKLNVSSNFVLRPLFTVASFSHDAILVHSEKHDRTVPVPHSSL